MNIDQQHIDDLFDGRVIHLPQALIDVLPSVSRKRDGRDICALMWHRIRMGERRIHKYPEDNGVAIYRDEFRGFASCDAIDTYRKTLKKLGFITIPIDYSNGFHSRFYKTQRRTNIVPYYLKTRSANDALSNYCTWDDVPCEYTKQILSRVKIDVGGSKKHFGDLCLSYLNQSDWALEELDRRQLIAYQNDEQKRDPRDRDLDGLATPVREFAHCRGRIHRGRNGRRLFSPLTQLKKTFREFLTLDDEPLICVDMTCCQPTLLGHLSNDCDLIRDCLNDVFYDQIAEELKVSHDVTVIDFKIDRGRAKQIFYEYLFGANRTWRTKSKDALRVQDLFKKLYPKTFQHVWNEKEQKKKQQKGEIARYKKFSHKLQQNESAIFVDGLLSIAQAHNIPCLTIHDAVLTTKTHEEELFCSLKNLLISLGIDHRFKNEDDGSLHPFICLDSTQSNNTDTYSTVI